jgi:hypothetical protein
MTASTARRLPIGSFRTVWTTTVLLAGLCAPAAHAQSGLDAQSAIQPVAQAAQPYRGVFGGGTTAAPGRHLLDLTTSVYQEYGNNTNSEIPTGSMVLSAGWFLGVRSGLSFQKAGRYTRVGVRGEGAFRFYNNTRQTTSPSYRVDAAVDHRTGSTRQNQLSVAGSASYEPYYTLAIFPSAIPTTEGTAILPTNRDDLLSRNARYIYAQSFGLEHQLSQRSYISLSETARLTRATTPGLDVSSIRAGVRYGYRISRDAALRLGYAYQTGSYGLAGTPRLTAHDLDISLDYRKPLGQSRRTSIGFGSGTSRIASQPSPRWVVVASANLRHELGAGWFLQGDFSRNTQLVEGFSNPFLVNTGTASVGGFMGHRVEWLASGAYSKGVVGFGSDRYEALQGSTRLRLGLVKYLAIDVEGLMNKYSFGSQVAIPGTVPADLNRWAVRCNIALWLPFSR